MSKYWIKAWVEILDDPKMGHLPHRTWRRAVELFLVAGDIDREGWIPSTEELAWRLRCSQDELADDLAILEGVQILSPNGHGWMIRRFAARQARVPPAERQRQHRKRKQQSQYYGHAPVTVCDTDQIQIREEQNRSEGSPAEPVTIRDTETEELWQRISDGLRLQMTQATHDRWFVRARLLRVEDGQVVIGFQNAAGVDWARTRLGRIIVATVSRELGRDVAVEYEVMK